ncbi:MAG TPA: aquaporin [Gemmatimonadaceae bacterium]|nr:aquaporin [Gemmatimonadaceae bacterium]
MKPAREFSAEFLGTFAVTFVSGAALMQSRNADAGAGLIDVALAHGLILFVMISAFMRLGGNLNPAVSLGLLVTGRITPVQAGTFIAGQFAGAMAAAFALKASFPAALWESARGTRQLVSLDVTTGQAFALEAVATAIVMFAFMATVVDRNGPRVGGLAVGMAAAVGFITIGPLTGGSMNPARTIGPMIATGAFEGLALYLAAPIVGAVLAAVAYRQLVTETE